MFSDLIEKFLAAHCKTHFVTIQKELLDVIYMWGKNHFESME